MKNIFSKIKAFFCYQDKGVEMELAAAEIKKGVVYLHPKDEKNVTYRIETNDVAIILSEGMPLSSTDVLRIDKSEGTEKEKRERSSSGEAKEKKRGRGKGESGIAVSYDEFDRFKKRKFVVSLYPEEYDVVMSSIKSYGYKRADFVMACVNSASRGNMERAHKKIVKSHEETLREQKVLEAQRQTMTSS